MAIPLPDGQRVWHQKGSKGEILPYHFDTSTTSAQRVDGTPHTWPDAQQAWNEGAHGQVVAGQDRAFPGYHKEQDIAFQFAMANAFTICDAYHCLVPGRHQPQPAVPLTGTNGPGSGQHAVVRKLPTTTTATARVEQAGLHPDHLSRAPAGRRHHPAGLLGDMADNSSDNPLIGFRQYTRAAAPDSPPIAPRVSIQLMR
ncbi:alkaline phosphatase family protein [Pseudomonas aeruginosa]